MKTKAFTLIELLVVVAIIGILAAVGVVAYNGYTSSAKKNVAKNMYSTAVRFISAELMKCAIGDEWLYLKTGRGADTRLNCKTEIRAVTVAGFFSNHFNGIGYNNPYDSTNAGLDGGSVGRSGTPYTIGGIKNAIGFLIIDDMGNRNGSQVKVYMKFSESETPLETLITINN